MKKRKWLSIPLAILTAFMTGAVSVFLIQKRKALITARKYHLEYDQLQAKIPANTPVNCTSSRGLKTTQKEKKRLQMSTPNLWLQSVAIIISLLLAAIGPALVLWDRWLDQDTFRIILRNVWCRSDILCRTLFPSYFIYILPATLTAVVLLVIFVPGMKSNFLATQSKKMEGFLVGKESPTAHRLFNRVLGASLLILFLAETALSLTGLYAPGPEYPILILLLVLSQYLRDFNLNKIGLEIRKIPTWFMPFTMIYIAVAYLMGLLANPSIFIAIPLTIIILGCIWMFPRWKQVPVVFWISLAVIPLYSLFINSWRFSVIGDEYVFFDYGKMVLENQPLRIIFENLLSPRTVIYGKFTFLSVLPNILSMALFGINNFGWRIINPLMCSLTLPFLYSFFNHFTSKKTAVLISLTMAGSHLMICFSKVGYNNLQGLLVMAILLWLTQAALKRDQFFYYLVLGLSIGLAMYMYPTTLAIIPLPFVLMFLFNNPFWIGQTTTRTDQKQIRSTRFMQWLWMGIGFIVLFMPILFEPNYWEIKMTESVFSSQMITDYPFHFITNILYTVFSPIYAPEESHFVVSSFLDPITGIFLFAGIAWGLKNLVKNKFALFMILGFAIQVFILGPTRDHGWTSVTHMFQLIPWLCAFAVLGIQWLLDDATNKNLPGRTKNRWMGVIVTAILLTNIYMAFVLSPQRSDRYHMVEALSLRFFKRTERMGISEDAQYLYLTSPGWDIHGIRSLQNVYGSPPKIKQLNRSPVYSSDDAAKNDLSDTRWVSIFDKIPELNQTDGMELPNMDMEEWAFFKMSDPNVIVAVDPLLPSDQSALMDRMMRQVGRIPCVLRASSATDSRITYWLPPEWEPLCPVNGIWEKYW